MKRQSRFTPAFLKIAIPFYIMIGVLVMGIGAAKSDEQHAAKQTVTSIVAVKVASTKTEF